MKTPTLQEAIQKVHNALQGYTDECLSHDKPEFRRLTTAWNVLLNASKQSEQHIWIVTWHGRDGDNHAVVRAPTAEAAIKAATPTGKTLLPNVCLEFQQPDLDLYVSQGMTKDDIHFTDDPYSMHGVYVVYAEQQTVIQA